MIYRFCCAPAPPHQIIYEPHHGKSYLGGLRPGKTQTGQLASLESLNLENTSIILSGQ